MPKVKSDIYGTICTLLCRRGGESFSLAAGCVSVLLCVMYRCFLYSQFSAQFSLAFHQFSWCMRDPKQGLGLVFVVQGDWVVFFYTTVKHIDTWTHTLIFYRCILSQYKCANSSAMKSCSVCEVRTRSLLLIDSKVGHSLLFNSY